jgi:hypothetical protein
MTDPKDGMRAEDGQGHTVCAMGAPRRAYRRRRTQTIGDKLPNVALEITGLGRAWAMSDEPSTPVTDLHNGGVNLISHRLGFGALRSGSGNLGA